MIWDILLGCSRRARDLLGRIRADILTLPGDNSGAAPLPLPRPLSVVASLMCAPPVATHSNEPHAADTQSKIAAACYSSFLRKRIVGHSSAVAHRSVCARLRRIIGTNRLEGGERLSARAHKYAVLRRTSSNRITHTFS